MKRALVVLLLAGCLDFNQGLKDCYVDGACHDAGAVGGGATGGGTAGGAAGGTAGGAAGGTAGGAAGGTAGGAAGGTAGGADAGPGWTTLAGPVASAGALNLIGIFQLPDGTLVTANDLDLSWRLTTGWNTISGFEGGSYRGLTGFGSALYAYGTGGYVYRWTGTAWTQVGVTNDDWLAGRAGAGGLLYVGGKIENGTNAILARSLTSGDNYDFGGASVTPVADLCIVPSTGVAWGVCQGGAVVVWEYDGGPQVVTPGQGLPRAIWCDDTDLVIAGKAGMLLERAADGGFVSVAPGGVTEDLLAIEGTSPTDLWVVGSGGVVLHGGRGSWARVPTPTAQTLNAVTVLFDGGVVAVGAAGTVLRRP